MERCLCCEREREGDSDFCSLHGRAYANLLKGFRAWRAAIPSMGVSAYLSRVLEAEGTGSWAAEVARQLLSQASSAERFSAEVKED
jgi:hypothetical protein